MTNEYIMKTALLQSAIDSNCDPQDFLDSENKVFISKKNPGARKYLELPYVCDFTSYGNNIVISSSTEFAGIAKSYADRFSPEHCFETPAIHLLGEEMRRFGMDICFMAEYFLPDTDCFRILPCKYRTEIIYGDELKTLYLPEWSNALCEKRKELDMLAVGAYDREKLIGLAGCSADCETMWQIGVDVLPEYRRNGIASALTSRLASEIFRRGKVPFYCAAWSNIKSVRNAIKCGFKPAWVQMTVKPMTFIKNMIPDKK